MNGRPVRARLIWLAVLGLLVAYVLLRPALERRLGVALPTIPLDAGTGDAGREASEGLPPVEPDAASARRPAEPAPPLRKTADAEGAGAAPDPESRSSPPVPSAPDPSPPSVAGGPAVARSADRPGTTLRPPPRPGTSAAARQPASATTAARLGQLTDLGGGVKRSTAGLRYTPGSEEGHRLTHVLRHGHDLPDRPGVHGVFDGDAAELLAVIDEAYLLAQQGGPRVTAERQGERLVYEVDLRRRIGFVGGQVGKHRGHPPATHVRLILEGDRVISAFPF